MAKACSFKKGSRKGVSSAYWSIDRVFLYVCTAATCLLPLILTVINLEPNKQMQGRVLAIFWVRSVLICSDCVSRGYGNIVQNPTFLDVQQALSLLLSFAACAWPHSLFPLLGHIYLLHFAFDQVLAVLSDITHINLRF